MKYIKTYESFKINETEDMFFMPVDPIKGAADMYKDIYNEIKDSVLKPIVNWLNEKGAGILNSIKPSKESLKKIYEFLMEHFGTISPDLSSENITKMIDVLELEKIKENNQEDEWHTVKGENLFVKLLATLKYLFGLNIAGWAGLPAFFTGLLVSGGSGTIGFVYWVAAFVITWVLIKVLELFGYDGSDTAAVGRYDADKDKFSGRFNRDGDFRGNTDKYSYGKQNIPVGGWKKYVFKDGKIVADEPVRK